MTMLGAVAVTPMFALLWSLLVLLSFVGWGYLLARALPVDHRDADWGLLAAWGMAALIALGGMLNLLALISPSICVALVLVGSALGLFHAFTTLHAWKARSAWPWTTVTPARLIYLSAIALVFSLGLARLCQILLSSPTLNGDDDFHAYLIFPLKMLESGWLVPDPFNSTYMGSLGGQAFLQTLLLPVLPVSYVHLLDPGVCLIVCSALIFGYQRKRHAGPSSMIATAALPLLLASSIDRGASASADITLMALYLALYRTFDCIWTGNMARNLTNELMVALVAASSIALKSTAVLYVAFLVSVTYAAFIWRQADRQVAIGSAIRATAGTGLLLAPWMIVMYLSAHTFLHPFLGEGYFGAAYGTFPKYSNFTQPSDLLADPWLILMAILATIYLSAFKLTSEERIAASCLSVATIGGTLAILWATAGNVRYTGSFTMAAILILCADVSRHVERSFARTLMATKSTLARRAMWALFSITTIASSVFLIVPHVQSAFLRVTRHRDRLARMDTPDYTVTKRFDTQASSLRRAQGAIPMGTTFVTYTNASFLLDFSRNRIYVIDWPYGASPAPGMPRGEGGDALSDYFLSKSIRYMLIDRGREGYAGTNPRCRNQLSAAPILSRRNGTAGSDAYECAVDLATADFLKNLGELVATQATVFHDGTLVVLDLSKRR
jgi:hypothetical protein